MNKCIRNLILGITDNEVCSEMLPLLLKLMESGKSTIFAKPVDTKQYPKYTTIIQHPMDLGTIKQRLTVGYYDEPWRFVDDVRLVFDNAKKFNKKNTVVYSYACDVILL